MPSSSRARKARARAGAPGLTAAPSASPASLGVSDSLAAGGPAGAPASYRGLLSELHQLVDGNPKAPARSPAAARKVTAPPAAKTPAAPAKPAHAAATFTVRPGDSLSAIAQATLGNASRWPEIYALNRSTIGPNPGLIQPGQVLALPSGSHAPTAQRAVAPAGPAPGGSVGQWIDQAVSILEANGVPASKLNKADIATIIEHESSGDPRAINLGDSNARAGHPSEGLMQTIGPTFDAYHLPGHDDIWNPVDNIIAGARYAIRRYGSVSNTPGIVSMAHGGPYLGY